MSLCVVGYSFSDARSVRDRTHPALTGLGGAVVI